MALTQEKTVVGRESEPSLAANFRIAIVDDHAIVREGLAHLIRNEAGFAVCGVFDGAESVIDSLATSGAEMVIIEIALKRIDGIALIKNIRLRCPQMMILVLSLRDECLSAEPALRAGAHGYVMKQEDRERLMTAIQCVVKGDIYLSQAMSARILKKYLNRSVATDSSPQACLSGRELEVFRLIGQGQGTRAIAEALHLSVKTVETYRAHIMEKLKLRNSIELLQRAMQSAELGE
jgi:DNA-binding NarL/FixJ family response regulator